MRSLLFALVLLLLAAPPSFAQSGGGFFSEKEMESVNRALKERDAAEQKRIDQLKKSGALRESQSGVVKRIESPRFVPEDPAQPQRSGGNVAYSDAPSRQTAATEPPRCSDLRAQMEATNTKYDARRSIVDAHADRSKFNMLKREYEAVCAGGTQSTEVRARPQTSDAEAHVRCPDGTYASSVAACHTDARTGKVKTMCPDGSYVAGVCARAPGGKYYGK